MGVTNWNFADLWETVSAVHPDAPVTLHRGGHLTWRDFDRRADAVASTFLSAGLVAQARVAQYLYNTPEYLESFYA
jgi:acyl-CoA synthetase (AMP-forming)/AMP-acid ligase II